MLLIRSIFLITLYSSFILENFVYLFERKHADKGWAASCSRGTKQSPININKNEVLTANRNIIFKNYDTFVSANLSNDGHTVHFHIDKSGDPGLLLDNNKEYRLYAIHFHWGCSEHTINNKSYELELHLLHSSKLEKSDGALVVAILFEKSEVDNEALNTILQIIRSNTTNIENKIKYQDLLPDTLHDVFQYTGSLTTPPCSEIVLWNIITEINYISEFQVKEFQTLSSDLPDFNCRPVKDINERKIYNLKIKNSSASTVSRLVFSSLILILIF